MGVNTDWIHQCQQSVVKTGIEYHNSINVIMEE